MSDEALLHRDHDLEFNIHRGGIGTFVYVTCLSCEYLSIGNVNVTVVLDHLGNEE